MKSLPENVKVFGKFDEYDADIIEALGLAYDITANSNGGRFDIEPKLEGTKYFDLELVYRLHHGLSINSEVNHEELREYQKDVERLGTTTVEIGDKSHNLTTTLAWVGWFKYKKTGSTKRYLVDLLNSPDLYRMSKGEDVLGESLRRIFEDLH